MITDRPSRFCFAALGADRAQTTPARHGPACRACAEPAPPAASGPCRQSLYPRTTAAELSRARRASEVRNPDCGAPRMRSWLDPVHRVGLGAAAATGRCAS